ncbi:unnamed protein product [Oppiella nova]|uniref:MYND-type domain-containing protein n=1 Tax=Oppiella nova TaxID=334625 RepID=A0A7R9MDA5_9ACAR|nr:unnamed protein product [Oppiella nova]CAG2175237.1 unnamed protein product [Oppiella nova]
MPSISTKPLTAGDVVFKCKPLLHCTIPSHKGKVCDNCLKRVVGDNHIRVVLELKKCAKCRQMYYCGKDCQTMDWKYHKKECKVFRHQDFKESNDYLFLRLYLCIKSDPTFATKRHQLFDGSDVCLNDMKVSDEFIANISTTDKWMKQLHIICKTCESVGIEYDFKELLQWFAFVLKNSFDIHSYVGDIPRLLTYVTLVSTKHRLCTKRRFGGSGGHEIDSTGR